MLHVVPNLCGTGSCRESPGTGGSGKSPVCNLMLLDSKCRRSIWSWLRIGSCSIFPLKRVRDRWIFPESIVVINLASPFISSVTHGSWIMTRISVVQYVDPQAQPMKREEWCCSKKVTETNVFELRGVIIKGIFGSIKSVPQSPIWNKIHPSKYTTIPQRFTKYPIALRYSQATQFIPTPYQTFSPWLPSSKPSFPLSQPSSPPSRSSSIPSFPSS